MNKKGFTLIELMIVMVIMGVLAAIGITSFMSSQIKGRDATRKGHLNAIAQALEMYYSDKKAYPKSDENGNILGCVGDSACAVKAPFKDANETIYMAQLPADPIYPKQTFYYVSTDGTQFQLYAHLENKQDLQCLEGNCTNPTVPSGVTCGTDISCNYGIASSNIKP